MKQSFIKIVPLLIITILLLSIFSPITASAATEAQIRSKIVSVAQNEVGYKGTSSYSKYGEWYGYQGGWCTTFVLWCFSQAGESCGTTLNGNIIPSGGNCNSMINWFTNKGFYHKNASGYSPKQGDLVFFDWSGNGSSQHVGIVTGVSGSTIYTIEGNCSGEVKSREYTKSGSKPYNNISAIMGYAAPDFSSAANEKSTTQKAAETKNTTTTSTTKKSPEATNQTAKKSTTLSTSESTQKPEKESSSSTTQAPSQTKLSKLTLRAATDTLQVGDSVKLEYTVEPSGTNAVVGYFCDEEGIIELGTHGEIKAIGTGTATVVVCANDDLYSQKDFVVTEAQAEVTEQTPESTTRKIVGTTSHETSKAEKSLQSQMTRMGINVNALSHNTQLYIIPVAIISATLIICLFIIVVKKIKNRKK